jgi:hypothetical protein
MPHEKTREFETLRSRACSVNALDEALCHVGTDQFDESGMVTVEV